MTPNLHPYPTYKPSGVQWLGDVPAHWNIRRLKAVCRFAYGDTLTAGMREYGSVPVYGSNGQVGVHSIANTMSPCIIVGRKGSFGKVNYVDEPAFAIDTTYFVDERCSQNNLRWLFYLLDWLRLDDTTKDSAIPGLSRNDAYQRLAFIPPLAEQAAIVRYLDDVDDRIQRYIASKERLIELLAERKQAVVNRAVTRGLDPNVPLKPSGVDWLGDVPAHWDVGQLRYLTECLDEIRIPLSSEQRGEIQGHIPYWGANRVIDHINDWLFDEPLVLLGEDGAPFFDHYRDVAFFVSTKIWVNNHAHVLRCGKLINAQFLTNALNCVDYTDHITGSTRDKLTQQAMSNIRIPIPPLTEQAAIVEYLDKATTGIDAAVARARRQIELMREYRTRLIADVVTGKVDVRGEVADGGGIAIP